MFPAAVEDRKDSMLPNSAPGIAATVKRRRHERPDHTDWAPRIAATVQGRRNIDACEKGEGGYCCILFIIADCKSLVELFQLSLATHQLSYK